MKTLSKKPLALLVLCLTLTHLALCLSPAAITNAAANFSSEKTNHKFNLNCAAGCVQEEYSLKLHGKVMKLENAENEKNLNKVCITVYNDRMQPFITAYTDNKGLFSVRLPLNGKYAIKTVKEGYVPKTISIDTYVPDDKKGNYNFRFIIDLFDDIKDMDVAVLKEPIAKISFNEYFGAFSYDYKYTEKTNNAIKQRYAFYYHHHQVPNTTSGKTVSVYPNIEVKQSLVQQPAQPITITENKKEAAKVNVQPTIVDMSAPGISFKIQILSMVAPLPLTNKVFENCDGVEEDIWKGIHKYTIGRFKTMKDAQEKMASIRKKGFSDAFIVSYNNGNRITMGDATCILKGFSENNNPVTEK